MNDETRLAIDDAETPVNPYSLLTAVNASSRSTNVAWLGFLGLMAYLGIAVASVTHRDLLLNADVTLPILQVKLGLTRFFLLVPILLVICHVGLIGQLVLLARRALEFTSALRLLESTDERSHPLRLELDNFFFVQAIAGPERSRVVSAFLNSMGWLTLVILPVALLIYVQVAFLPFHDSAVTLVHRLIVLADILLLALIGVFLMRPEVSYFGAFWRTALHNPGSLAFGIAVLAVAAVFSLLVATVPGAAGRPGLLAAADGSILGVVPRNLHVTDADLVAGRLAAAGERSVSLYGRDLRFARLDRTDLRQADMTGANLDGASLIDADLRGVRLQCAELADLVVAEQRQGAQCSSARGANFTRARMADVKMVGVDARGAQFDEAWLENADLSQAQIAGTSFTRARLDRADVSGAALQGATFLGASLQGADLSGARLQMADLSGAGLQGAALSLATLEGATLRDADLEGASLLMTRLFGADMGGAKLQFVDMSGAMVWRTVPPAGESAVLADVASVSMRPPTDEDVGVMKSTVAGLDAGPLKVRLTSLMAPLSDAAPNATWAASPEGQAWAGLARTSEAAMADGYRARLTEQLARLACRARFGNGAVAAGVIRRAVGPGFKGDPVILYERLKAADCLASASLPPRSLRDLAVAADAVRGP
ncbi:MAG: pentapeptide repeat-containing protein [Hyphomonadaceae bacterium]|nr:pentapeptide repeat-containing protein [Hyphomonadaceae bacterium]